MKPLLTLRCHAREACKLVVCGFDASRRLHVAGHRRVVTLDVAGPRTIVDDFEHVLEPDAGLSLGCRHAQHHVSGAQLYAWAREAAAGGKRLRLLPNQERSGTFLGASPDR